MKNKLEKYDYMALFILILGVIFIIQQYLFAGEIEREGQKLEVEVVVSVGSDVESNNLDEINELYFSNSLETSKVLNIKKVSTEKVDILFVGEGVYSDDKVQFEGQHIGINQRVKIHGLLEAEGYVVSITPVISK